MLRTALPQYAPLAEFLLDSGAYLDASELHGLLCGFISGGLRAPNIAWLGLLLSSAQENRRLELEACVRALFDVTYQQLSSFGFDLEILLPTPEEGQDLLLINSLSRWSEHFMLGLSIAEALTQKNNKQKLDLKTIKEAKQDIQKVSRIYNQILQCNETFDEEAFVALLEHVRVATMLIFTELNSHIRPTQH